MSRPRSAAPPFTVAIARPNSTAPSGGVVSQAFVLEPGVEAFPGYLLHLPLGRGGCGQVWEAIGPHGRTVALKFVPCRDSSIAAKEARTIQAIRRLRHPNLIYIEEVFVQPGYVVIAMELAEGSLMDLLEGYNAECGTPIPGPEVLKYLSQAAVVIDFLNARRHEYDGRTVGYQHCDIKPGNLLIKGGLVKLADFGLSTAMTANQAPFARMGTLEFAAQEIFLGQLSDRSDQYALAVSYCLLRGGRLPFADTPKRFVSSYCRPQPDLSMLPQAERPAIHKALAGSPVLRWPSCTTLMDHLRRAVEPVARKVLA